MFQRLRRAIGNLAGRKRPPVPQSFFMSDHQKLAALLSLVDEQSRPNINALTILTRNLDVMALNIKALGYDLARTLADALPPPGDTQARIVGLCSKLSTQADLESDWAAHWCAELGIGRLFHRKVWENVFILQALHDAGHLRPGARGLGFGCGAEPMASYFAARGVDVLATDLPAEDARARGWSDTNQHAASLEQAFHPHLVDRATFDARVRFRPVDMNAIPPDLAGFDFCWSMCAFEHLGSIAHGLAFVRASLGPLRPGGTAVHTTEFNINPDGPTVDNWPTVLFQRRHMEALAAKLRAEGHRVAQFDYSTGNRPLDHFIDMPPWHDGTMEQISRSLGQPHHLKVAADNFIATCIGLIVTKGDA